MHPRPPWCVMLRIETTLDLADFDRSVGEAVDGYVMPTLADGLNEIADTVVERLVEAQAAQLAGPKTLRSDLINMTSVLSPPFSFWVCNAP